MSVLSLGQVVICKGLHAADHTSCDEIGASQKHVLMYVTYLGLICEAEARGGLGTNYTTSSAVDN